MESQRFDDLSRKMASGASRRTMLRGILGGALAAAGLRGGAVAKPNKVDICHRTGNGSYHRISVSVNALDAHLRHGDYTDCGAGSHLNLDTCECEIVNLCEGKEWCDQCGNGGNCLEDGDGGLYCDGEEGGGS